MIAMIFEFWFDPDDPPVFDEYLAEATVLRELLKGVVGFEGVERFQSVTEPGKFMALGFFRDEDAVTRWRANTEHRRVQTLGREKFFTNYRLRMAEVVRDYGPGDRTQAPGDSRQFHH